jgi:hypothetical protein
MLTGCGLVVTGGSKQVVERVDCQTRLPDNGSKRTWFQITSRMDRHGDSSTWVVGVDKDVVTAGHPLDHQPRALQRPNDPPAAYRRQTGTHAAIVTLRRVGGMSSEMAIPCLRR